MLAGWLCRTLPRRPSSFGAVSPRLGCVTVSITRLASSIAAEATPLDVARTRNIGIIAHIDAGKTTTTERMLYYSGFTRRLGDVDEGSTVTDFLPAERARGITIQSAAVTFSWPPSRGDASPADVNVRPRSIQPHNINLIDTPGHADFTFEVLRSLRILDGAVCILDGVAGVEAQTEKVWTQAAHYQIPKILLVNKLDRDGAAFANTVREIGTRLHCWPALCTIPWWRSSDSRLQGVGDAVNLRGILYEEGSDGKTVENFDYAALESQDSAFAAEVKQARIALVELLSEHDDEMVERFLEHDEDHLAIPAVDITESLRRCTLASPQTLVPVFAGASFRNVGVQPLLDAVVDLLPSPAERPDSEISIASATYHLNSLLKGDVSLPQPQATGGKDKKDKSKALAGGKTMHIIKNLEACALAFKVVTDPRRGALVYVRVYSGTLTKNSSLFNTNLGVTEKAPRLLKMYADEAVEVNSVPAGQIAAIPGLKFARTGDTLLSYIGSNPKSGPPAPINSLQLRPIAVPPPVFFTSVEPNSLAEEKHLGETLELLLREDPSLHVHQDAESGQTHLAGMGELHLEIARDRLITDLKAKARTGSIQIGYREAITTGSDEQSAMFDREIAGKASKAGCVARVEPLTDIDADINEDDDHIQTISLPEENRLVTKTPTLYVDGSASSPDAPSLPSTLPMQSLCQALQTGASAALARGPSHGYPIHSTQVTLTFEPQSHLFPSTTAAAISSAARLAVQQALRSAKEAGGDTVIMEPVMLVTISVDEASLGGVVHDITSARGGQVISLGSDETDPSQSDGSRDFIDPRKIYAPPDPFAGSNAGINMDSSLGSQMRQIVARVPLKEMVGYLKHLRSLTQGRGTFVMSVDRFERMSAQRMKVTLGEMSGEY
ncbi:hypothetical protein AAFC00_004047 [Neodothiora populina]|uniref:Ribosome-releasing factor 2, mitochondrial n=1 Tax=Neodothiora populina TaxID=2781224 RepID=A0ABR3PIQ5_9PEZI